MVKIKTCIFISGQGTNLKNIINRSRDKNFPVEVSLVLSNNKNAKRYFSRKKIQYTLY